MALMAILQADCATLRSEDKCEDYRNHDMIHYYLYIFGVINNIDFSGMFQIKNLGIQHQTSRMVAKLELQEALSYLD